jgi:hypothetical protein
MYIKKSLSVLAAVTVTGVLLSACSSDKPCPTGYTCAEGKPPVKTRSAEFQKRIDAEKAAEDLRDRNGEIQERQNREQRELKALRAERAAQRDERRKQREEAEAREAAEARAAAAAAAAEKAND